jgi:hypothetical protein
MQSSFLCFFRSLLSEQIELVHEIGQPGGPQSSTAGDTGVSSSSCGQKLNLLHSSKYVLTYMDHEGDLMLVGGDVPWEDFTTNVQRLRITKGDDIARRGGEIQ